jgi:S-DNA-T family DNA segregation ATPase FtsK/SpoIIIE
LLVLRDDDDLWTEPTAREACSGSIAGCVCCSRSSIRWGQRCRSTSRSRLRPGTPLAAVRHGLLGAVGRLDGLLYAGDRQVADDDALGEPPAARGGRADRRPARPVEPRGLLELHVVAGPDSGAVHRLSPGEHGIGRSVEATIRIDDPDVSRLHAVLRVAADGSGTTVHDLASTNGTTVDDEPVAAPADPFSLDRCCGSATPGCASPGPRWCPSPAGRTGPATSR